ncbi:M56 family metallopeptidase [Colwellia sp. Arc7-D]|uniref:M56 family metallopeptidase n=1 Tax=Colwellia sp. Arc7-D TaxID=2161872 RepID=UPI000D34FAD8|nr:M56 family metallopeptidase [Colwellia sp. Arc7-D]AWB56348.1 peptidase M56 [Colwellia sp. Arc7-D]
MFQESLINNPLLAALAITLIHFLWQGVLVAAVLKALLSLISYQKSQLRYALSTLAMLANLILPAVTFFLVYDIDYRQVTHLVYALPLLDQSLYLEQIQTNVWYIEWLEYLPLLTIVWLSFVIVLALKLIIELYNVNRLPLQGCSAADATLQKRFDSLITKVGLSRHIPLLLSSKTDVPMAIGWLKPVVLLPFSMISGLTPQQLDMLLLHELAHIRRHDYLVNFLQTLVEITLFFHPGVRWVSKQMRNEREYCSDDIAVQHCGSPLAYAHTLADTASLCVKHRHNTIPNMAMAASGGDLKQRVVRLLDHQQHCTKTNDSGKWLASISILLTVIFLFSKYSLTLPIIDLQSGSISLYNSAAKVNKNWSLETAMIIEQDNNNSSLASRLLAIDNSTSADSSSIPSQNRKAQKLNSTLQPITKAPLKSQGVVSEYTTNPYYNELPFVDMNVSDRKNITQHQAELSGALVTNQPQTKTRTKSMSDLAFERTDSKQNIDKNNAYSKQISTLLNEPITPSDDVITALNKTQASNYYQASNPLKLTANINRFNQAKLSNNTSENKGFQLNMVAAKLLNSADPKYPISAKRKGIELEVMVEFDIDRNGLVKNIEFESKSKVNYFRSAIRNAMEKWRFLPAKENGRAVESKMSKIFSFSLLN